MMECHEVLSRLRKAIALSHVILASGFTVENLEDGAATEEFWGIAAKGAEFKAGYLPSRETREVTMRLLTDFRETQKRLEALSGIR